MGTVTGIWWIWLRAYCENRIGHSHDRSTETSLWHISYNTMWLMDINKASLDMHVAVCGLLTSTSSGGQACDRLYVSVVVEEVSVVPSRGCPTSAITSSTFSILTLSCGQIWVCRAMILPTKDAGNRLLVSRLTAVSARLRLRGTI